jgi:hypothetical protein
VILSRENINYTMMYDMEGLNDDASGGEEKIALMVRSKYSKLFLD